MRFPSRMRVDADALHAKETWEQLPKLALGAPHISTITPQNSTKTPVTSSSHTSTNLE
jgi:hypothetical protein